MRIIWNTCRIRNAQIKFLLNHVPTTIGVNPRGIYPNDIWQTDVIHVPSFGHLEIVHVSVDTYSGMTYTSAHSRETSAHVISHFLQVFSYMSLPKHVKTDNGPAYVSHGLAKILSEHFLFYRYSI